eukprot:4638471-Prymnesium_polylepis.1
MLRDAPAPAQRPLPLSPQSHGHMLTKVRRMLCASAPRPAVHSQCTQHACAVHQPGSRSRLYHMGTPSAWPRPGFLLFHRQISARQIRFPIKSIVFPPPPHDHAATLR